MAKAAPGQFRPNITGFSEVAWVDVGWGLWVGRFDELELGPGAFEGVGLVVGVLEAGLVVGAGLVVWVVGGGVFWGLWVGVWGLSVLFSGVGCVVLGLLFSV